MIFFVEDGPHKSLLCFLGIGQKRIFIMGAKGNVIGKLKDHPSDTGMVDEDPDSAQPHDLSNYTQVPATEGLRLRLRRGNTGQRLIVVCPRIEEWLIQRAMICGIDPRQYHLPSTPKELHNIPRYEQKDGFPRFLAELNDRDRGMDLLRQWIRRG